MAKSLFNKAVIAADLQLALRRVQIGTSLINRNFEGQINKIGDSVTIITPQSTTIRPYSASTDITVDEMDAVGQVMTLDKANYFAFYAHDVESIGAAADAFVREDAYVLADRADTEILKSYAAAGIEVSFDPATDDALAMVREVKRKMDLANVPSGGRYLALSPYEVEAIEEKLTNRQTAQGDATVAAGFQGQLYGFSIYQTNSLVVTDTGTVRHALAGTTAAVTYADAILELEVIRAEKRFANLCRGLHVFATAVVRPEALVDISIAVA